MVYLVWHFYNNLCSDFRNETELIALYKSKEQAQARCDQYNEGDYDPNDHYFIKEEWFSDGPD